MSKIYDELLDAASQVELGSLSVNIKNSKCLVINKAYIAELEAKAKRLAEIEIHQKAVKAHKKEILEVLLTKDSMKKTLPTEYHTFGKHTEKTLSLVLFHLSRCVDKGLI